MPIYAPHGVRVLTSWRAGPHGFLQRFGAEQVQMVDCRDGKSVHWLTLAHFFSGYLLPWTRALCPDTFRKMMLKLKDWPPDQASSTTRSWASTIASVAVWAHVAQAHG